ncbi:MAG: nuclear transport factor 2 family protein [Solirubrobacterales bacterium]
MDRATIAAVIERFSAAWEAGDVETLMALMAAECEFRASLGPEPGRSYTGREAVREAFEGFLAPNGGPAAVTESVPVLIGPDFAVTRWTVRVEGRITVRGCDVFEFDGELIRCKDTYRKSAG